MTRPFLLIVMIVAAARAHGADPPEPLAVPPRPLEEFKFPPGTIIVVRDSRQGLGNLDAVVLSPEEYRRMQETIEQLQKRASADRPTPPSRCRIRGRVESRGQNEIVKIQVEFEYVSPQAKAIFFLGLRRAAIVRAVLKDGSTPTFLPGNDGYTVMADRSGSHLLTIDLEALLQTREAKTGDRGFSLNLPGSPITTIEQFEAPAGVAAVRFRPLTPISPLSAPPPARTIATRDLLKPAGDWPALALGPVDGMEIFWDRPMPNKPTSPVLSVDGEIRIQLSETVVQSTAALTFQSRGGRTNELKLQTPPGADINFPDSIEGTVTATSVNDERSQWVIRTSEPGIDTLRIEVASRATRQGKPLPVGPYFVPGSLTQQGTIRISSATHLRPLASRLRGDVVQQELPGENASPAESVQSMFVYGRSTPPSPASPLLFLDVERIPGELRSQTTHSLSLTEAGWRLICDIRITPIRTEFEVLELEVPAALHSTLEAGPRELVERIERVNANSDIWRIRLARPRWTEVTLRVEAIYPRVRTPAALGRRDTYSLILPRVTNADDRDGRVNVRVPEGFALRGTIRERMRDRIGETGVALETDGGKPETMTASTDRSPAIVELSRIALSALAPAKSFVDASITDHQMQFVHRIVLPGAASQRQFVLRTLGPNRPQMRAAEGGVFVPHNERDWMLTVPASGDREVSVTLNYSQPFGESGPAPGLPLELGLLWPVASDQSETLLRIWTQTTAGLQPHQHDGAWIQLPATPVSDHESLPSLVLHATGEPPPLRLGFTAAAGLMPAGVVAERALIQVAVNDSGLHRYFVRLLLQKVNASFVDVQLPVPIEQANGLEVYVAGKRLDQVMVVDAAGVAASPATSQIVRIPLAASGRTVEVALSYMLPGAGWGGFGRWQLRLNPPQLPGLQVVGAVRWQVLLPGEEFVLPGDDRATLEQRWGFRRLLPAPVPALSGRDLERWFHGAETENDTIDGYDGAIVRHGRLEPVRLFRVPRMVWYLVCSLVVLAVGGSLLLMWQSRWLFWFAATMLLLASAAAALLWPQTTLTFIVGMPPGALVLAVLAVFLGWQARRYRRRVVFMPGFTRTKPASTANHAAPARRREQSTVDAPSAH